MVEFGLRLKRAREKKGLNQTELGLATGLKPSAIGHFEKERRAPSFKNLYILCSALNVSADYILGLKETT